MPIRVWYTKHMQIYFIRHGESIANAEHWVAGDMDIELSDKGHRDAENVGRSIHNSGVRFDRIIASGLTRAHDTAASIALHLGYSMSDIDTYEDLNERHHGTMQGKPLAQMEVATSQQLQRAGQETVAAFRERVQRVMTRIDEQYGDDDRILIVAHAGVYRILKMILDELPDSAYLDIKKIDNTLLERLQ